MVDYAEFGMVSLIERSHPEYAEKCIRHNTSDENDHIRRICSLKKRVEDHGDSHNLKGPKHDQVGYVFFCIKQTRMVR